MNRHWDSETFRTLAENRSIGWKVSWCTLADSLGNTHDDEINFPKFGILAVCLICTEVFSKSFSQGSSDFKVKSETKQFMYGCKQFGNGEGFNPLTFNSLSMENTFSPRMLKETRFEHTQIMWWEDTMVVNFSKQQQCLIDWSGPVQSYTQLNGQRIIYVTQWSWIHGHPWRLTAGT